MSRPHEGDYRRVMNRVMNDLGEIMREFRQRLYAGEFDDDIRGGKQLFVGTGVPIGEFLKTDE